MSFVELMNKVGGYDRYSRAVQTAIGRAAVLALIGVRIEDIDRLAKLDTVISLLQNLAENDNIEDFIQG